MAGLHILVVDDCPEITATMALFLRCEGHHVELAHDGSSAIAKAKAGQPDVVLLDIALPDMSGHDVARHLREQLFDKPLLIVALTGYGREDDRRRSQESGIDMHLVKPVDPLDLKNMLSRFARVVA